jgi:hypothetical protein
MKVLAAVEPGPRKNREFCAALPTVEPWSWQALRKRSPIDRQQGHVLRAKQGIVKPACGQTWSGSLRLKLVDPVLSLHFER